MDSFPSNISEEIIQRFVEAAEKNNGDLVTSIISKFGKDVLNKKYNEWTALMKASHGGYLSIVSALLRAGADANFRDNAGWTALMLASWKGQDEVVSCLVSAEANVNLQNNNGFSALIWASQEGHASIVSTLLSRGAQVNATNNDGATALILASMKGHKEVVSALLQANSSPDIQTKTGWTALMWASRNGHSAVIAMLGDAGADINIHSKDGKTAIGLAKTEAIRLLLESYCTDAAVKGNAQELVETRAGIVAPGDNETTSSGNSKLLFAERALRQAARVVEQADNTVKLVLVGAGRAGKSGLARSLLGRPFVDTPSTVGVESFTCDISTAHIIDGARQEGVGRDGGMWTESEVCERQLEEKLAFYVLNQQAVGNSEEVRGPTDTADENNPLMLGNTHKEEIFQTADVTRSDAISDDGDKVTANRVNGVSDKEAGLASASLNLNDTIHADLFFKALGEGQLLGMKYKTKIYDFGGQAIFNSIHHFFLTKQSVYLVVFNMEWLVSKDSVERTQCLRDLSFWINSIVMHTGVVDEDGVGFTCAPIALVGTHKDIITSSRDHEKISVILSSSFGHSPAFEYFLEYSGAQGIREETTLVFFPVDNTRGRNDVGIKKLAEGVEAELESAPNLQQKHPVSWFYFYDKLVECRSMVLSYQEVREVARVCCVEEMAIAEILGHYHNLGYLLWLDEDGFRDVVVMEPVQFFVTPLTKVICNHVPNDKDPDVHRHLENRLIRRKYRSHWKNMISRGIVSDLLLRALLHEHSAHLERVRSLMIRYGFLVPFQISNVPDQQYFVPALLPQSKSFAGYDNTRFEQQFYLFFFIASSQPSESCLLGSDLVEYGFLPNGLFERLLGHIFRWSIQTYGSDISDFEITNNSARLFFGSQMFRLTISQEINSILVEVQGKSPLLVHDRLFMMTSQCLKESMGNLSFLTLVPHRTHASQSSPKNSYNNLLFIRLENIQKAIIDSSKIITKFVRDRRVTLEHLNIQKLYGGWTTIPTITDTVDVFISYRWGRRDSEFTGLLYDRSTTVVVEADSHRNLVVFLDRMRLQEGDAFREDFISSLIKTRVFVPIVSSDSVLRMVNHDSASIDNLLLEWICAFICHDLKIIPIILPIIFGPSSTQTYVSDPPCRPFSEDPHLKELPSIVPRATIDKAYELLSKAGIQVKLSDLERFTVNSLVNDYMANKFMGILACNKSGNTLISDTVSVIYSRVNQIVVKLSSVRVASEPDSLNAITTAAPAHGSILGQPSSNQVAHLADQRDLQKRVMTLAQMVDILKRELNIAAGNYSNVIRTAAETLLEGEELTEFACLADKVSKAKYLLRQLGYSIDSVASIERNL